MPSPSRRIAALLACASLAASALVACAEGSQLGAFGESSSGDGGTSGDGGRGAGGEAAGDGGSSSIGGTASSGALATSSTSTSGTTSSATTGSTSAATTSASSSVTTAASSTASATTSASSGGGDPLCDPLSPAVECGANMHCLPEPDGVDPSCAPAGPGGVYDPCLANTDCTAITECIDVGDPFAFPCCLQYCRNAGDCGGLGACEFFDPPLFADGIQFGVCYDGGPGC